MRSRWLRSSLISVLTLVGPGAVLLGASSSSAQSLPPIVIPPGLLGGSPTTMSPVPITVPGVATVGNAPDGKPYVPPPGAAEWTVLAYEVADNDLEQALLDDLNEMECAGSTKQVNVVMEIDRWRPDPGDAEADSDDTRSGDWDDARRFLVTKDGCDDEIHSKQIEDMGEIDMSHPKELAKFIAWAVQKYPAKHYALLLGDHGDGWRGAYVDENAPPEPQPMLMALSELQDALAEGRKLANIPKFDLLATDACLMGSVEVADALAPHVLYWAASEELVPGPGYDYTQVIGKLDATPTMDALSLGKVMIGAVRTFYGDKSNEDYDPTVTQALFDMSKAPVVRAAVDKFATLLKSDLVHAKFSLGQAAAVVDQFGPQADPTGAHDGFADAVQIAAVVRDTSSNAEIKAAATALIAAIDATRVDMFDGEDRSHARGMSLWLPPNEDISSDISGYRKTPFGKSSPWADLMGSYAVSFDKSVAPKISNIQVIKNPLTPFAWQRTVTAQIDGEVRDAVMIVSQNLLSSVIPVEIDPVTDPALYQKLPEGPGVTAWKSGSNTVTVNWNPTYATLAGKGGIEFPLVVNRQRIDSTTFDSEVTLRSLTSNAEEPVMLRFSMGAGGFAGAKLLTGFFIDSAEGETLYTAFEPSQLPPGKVAFEPRYTVIDASGKSSSVTLPLSVKWDKLDDLKINVRPMLPGIYTLTFVAEDYAGHIGVSKITTTLP